MLGVWIADHHFVFANTACKGVIASTRALAEKALFAARRVQGCGFMIAIEPPNAADGQVIVQSWQDALVRGQREDDGVAAVVAGLGRGDLACIIHTSGTGGQPKGVMLHHGAILTNCLGAYHLLEQLGLGDEVFLSFLPLSHSYEHSAGECFPLSIGAQIYFAESVEALSSNLVEVKPTIMTAVPRLYETLHRRIASGVERQGGLKAALFISPSSTSGGAKALPVTASQIRAVPSLLAVTMRVPSGLNTALFKAPSCTRTEVGSLPEVASQTRAV